MLQRNHLDRIRIAFDDHRLVANAGLILPATLALHLGHATGRANTGDKMMTLVASALAGGDCIDDADALRAGGTARVLGFTAKAPSTPRFREGRLWVPSCAASGVLTPSIPVRRWIRANTELSSLMTNIALHHHFAMVKCPLLLTRMCQATPGPRWPLW